MTNEVKTEDWQVGDRFVHEDEIRTYVDIWGEDSLGRENNYLKFHLNHMLNIDAALRAKDREIAELKDNIKNQSDGYHTMAQLYEHR